MRKHKLAACVFNFLLLWALAFLLLPPGVARAAHTEKEALGMISPFAALVSPNGARLDVSQKALVEDFNGECGLSFIIPANADNLQVEAPGLSIVRWSSSPALPRKASGLAQMRAKVEKERAELAARLLTLKARLGLWQGQLTEGQDIQQRESLMGEAMPGLDVERAAVEEKLKDIDQELAEMPPVYGAAKKINVIFADARDRGREVEVKYSYTLPNCGWQAVYNFNARPDEGKGDMIDARLMAEVWQYSGMDWRDTRITLSTSGVGPREPAPLPKWIIDSTAQKPQPRVMAASARGADHAVADEAAPMMLKVAPPNAPVSASVEGVYARWTLSSRTLPEGRARLEILADAWKAPLQWLARPSMGDSRVWLLAKCELPTDRAWPRGLAEYSVNGQSVGQGDFTPKGGEAVLYFGADPGVNVKTIMAGKKQGESGIITTSKTWTWAWTYVIQNQNNKPVKVKVERPAPMIVDEGVTATFNNKPKAQEDKTEHMLYWIVDVPAHGETKIDHSVTITSPTKLPILPDVP